MAITLVNLTGDVADLIAEDFALGQVRVGIDTNVDGPLVDEANNVIRMGATQAVVNSNGTFTFTGLIATDSADVNPTGFQYRLWVEYFPAFTRKVKVQSFGWFSLTATSDLSDVVAEQYVPPTWMSSAIAELQGYVDAAEAAAEAAEAAVGMTAAVYDPTGVEDDAFDRANFHGTDADLAAHLSDATDAHDASAISYAGGTGMSATDVEAAIDELATEKANLASPTFTGTVSGVTKAHVGLGNVDNTADSAKPVSSAQQTALDAKLDDSQLDVDGTLAANSDAKIASQKAVRTYVSAVIAATDVMVFKGVIDCSANPNYPAADAGHLYRVSVAGKIGGASGVVVQVGDELLCLVDSTASGNQATVGANWNVTQANIDGAVIGPTSATDNDVVLFDSTSGKQVKSGGTVVSQVPAASATVQGKVELATDAETTTGTDTVRATTPANVKAAIDARLVDASTTVKGISELATSAETVTGTDTVRATTPAGVKAALDARAGQLLGFKSYNGADYFIESATQADVDATNLAVTFTAPASGNVLVRLTGKVFADAGNSVWWGLREASSEVVTKRTVSEGAGFDGPASLAFPVAGLTPGSSHTYKWAMAANVEGYLKADSAGDQPPAVMEVTALP